MTPKPPSSWDSCSRMSAPERKGAGWGGRATVRHLHVCVRARACAYALVYVTYTHSLIQSHSCLCVRFTCQRESVFQCHPFFGVLCAPGSAWNSRWRSCIERTRVASPAPFNSYGTAWHCGRTRPLRPPSWASGASRQPSQAPWANGVADGRGETSGTASSTSLISLRA